MRLLSLLTLGVLLTLGGRSGAETTAPNEVAQQWNRWVCRANAPGWRQSFWGFSYYFRAGSGEGQQARSLAHLSALRNCEFRTGRQCFSRLETHCQVQRF